jgi:hypothetical protein
MPLLRYFVFVGGALLALLLISNAYFPKTPDQVQAESGFDPATIRIHSDRKWPERVVFDTNQPPIVLGPAADSVQAPVAVVDASAKARVRDSFAQLQPPDEKQPQLTDPKKAEKTVQRKRRVAKRRAVPPVMLVAQQPQFSLFGNRTW